MAINRVLVLVTGSGPGLGKSTLAEGLARTVSEAGRSVVLFRELDIETHPSFSSVMEEFKDTGEVSRSTLLAAASDYLQDAENREAEVIVLDALFAYLPSL